MKYDASQRLKNQSNLRTLRSTFTGKGESFFFESEAHTNNNNQQPNRG